MKIFLTFISIILMLNTLSAQWNIQTTIPGNETLQDIFFIDQEYGWCVGNGAIHYCTENGGNLWELMENLDTDEVRKVQFVDENYGWVGGDNGIYSTNNGGCGMAGNWNQVQVLEPDYALPFFIDSLNGWLIESYSGYPPPDGQFLFRTYDGGENWIPLEFFDGYIGDLAFVDSIHGWIVGVFENYNNFPRVMRTIDGGQNWMYHFNNYPPNFVRSICFLDPLNGWITGNSSTNGYIYHSSDGGNTWDQQGNIYDFILFDITFIDYLNGWAVGDGGNILYTTDGGENWEFQESGTSADLFSVCFITENLGWICGENGTILHTNNGGIVGLNKQSKKQTKLSIFPNPSNGTSIITVHSHKEDNINLRILNICGQEIKNIRWENKNSVDYKLNCHDLLPGLYFICLKTNTDIKTEKFVIN